MARLRRLLRSPGVRQFGLPAAVATAILSAGSERGLHWTTFFSLHFAVQLLLNVLIIGLGGGFCYQWLLAKAGFPLEREP